MSVRTHGTFGILNDGPSTIFEWFAYLCRKLDELRLHFKSLTDHTNIYFVVGEESGLTSEFAGLSGPFSRSVESVVVGILECEWLAVERDAENKFSRISSQLDPVIERVISVEISDVSFGMEAERSDVSRLLVPMAVIVVRHDTDPVEISWKWRHVVAGVDDGLGRRDGRWQQPTSRSERGSQFTYQRSESRFVRCGTSIAIHLREKSGSYNFSFLRKCKIPNIPANIWDTPSRDPIRQIRIFR